MFIQRSLGDVYFDSLADFQARKASRIRLGGAVPSLNPADAAADFNTNALTPASRMTGTSMTRCRSLPVCARIITTNHDKPPLNPNFQSRYGFTNQETFNGRGLLQPRLGFNWKAAPRLIVKGGTGIFGGGTPQVFLSNSFSNTGLLTNSIDIARTTTRRSVTSPPRVATARTAAADLRKASREVTGTSSSRLR